MPVSWRQGATSKGASSRAAAGDAGPGLVELTQLIHQNEHLPSKLGRHLQCDESGTLGKVGDNKEKAKKGSAINVGFGIGARPVVQVSAPPEPQDDDVHDGELVDDFENKDDELPTPRCCWCNAPVVLKNKIGLVLPEARHA